MDSNQQRFVEDALDLLNELDEGLMQLEENPQATAPLEQLFRTIHTIKGAANMFGFEAIGALSHQLEALFDLVRQGKIPVTDGLISITLQAFDKVRGLLKESDIQKINASVELKEHTEIATHFLHQVDIASGGMLSAEGAYHKNEVATFYIKISPVISITTQGNHPLVFIVQDLESVGTAKTFLQENATGEIVCWELFLTTTSPQPELESFFLFVEQDCKAEIHKLGAGNLCEDEEFNQAVESFVSEGFNLEIFQALAATIAEKNRLTAPFSDEEEEEINLSRKKIKSNAVIKVSKYKIDELLDWISELIILQTQVSTIASASTSNKLRDAAERLEIITTRLRDTSLEIGLVPVETLVTKFKRLVRDLSRSLHKKVNFLSEGAETEMDKDVIELMAEPLMHMIRNAIDHGIEKPEQRRAAGKSEHGTVRLKAFNSSAYAHILVSDDGKGIDSAVVLKKAIEQGLVQPDAELSEADTLNLIFHAGLSTASQVSDVSGRGVGMDVVRQRIHELRGSVSVKSQLGKGTSIHIKLPLSRSIIDGLLVRVAEARYVVPLSFVDRIDRIPYQELNLEHRLNKTVIVNGEPLSVFSLRKHFHEESEPPKTSDIISITLEGITKGLAVDRIEGKMQAVLKPLGDVYQQQDYLAGSTILGDGTLALVLDPQRLFKLADNKSLTL
ncbi:MAG: chemotaxis protein CheA [Bacteroidota bacterium]